MKNTLVLLLASYCLLIKAQNKIEFQLTLDPPNGTFNGVVRVINPNKTYPGSSTFKAHWNSLTGITNGLNEAKLVDGECNLWQLTTDSWFTINANTTSNIMLFGNYEGNFDLPPFFVDQDGDTLFTTSVDHEFIPSTINMGEPEFYHSELRQVKYGTDSIKIGKATIRIWGDTLDAVIPANKGKYAIACAHAASIVNNYAGFEFVTPNTFFSRALIESACGCEDDIIIAKDGAEHPITHQPSTVTGGCFQLLSIGWAQLGLFYPESFENFSYTDNISGNNFVRACITNAYYDISTLNYIDRIGCFSSWEFLQNKKDPYFSDIMLFKNYHDGMVSGLGFANSIIVQNPTYVDSLNIVESATSAGIISGTTNNTRNVRNIMMFLNNDTTNAGGFAELDQNFLDKSIYEWKGWYNYDIFWADVENYIDEIGTLFPNADLDKIKSKVQPKFDAINGTPRVPFVHLGPVIDQITLSFPTYNPDFGTNLQFHASACDNRSDIKITSCTNAYDDSNIKIDCYGQPPFSFEVKDENGDILYKIEGDSAPSYMFTKEENLANAKQPTVLSSNTPLVYIDNFSNGNGYTRLNAHLSVVELGESLGQTVSSNKVENNNKSTNLYPNPIQIGDHLLFDKKFNSIEILNSFGQLVYFNSYISDLNSIQITNDKFSPGIYFIRLDNKLSSQKLIVTK